MTTANFNIYLLINKILMNFSFIIKNSFLGFIYNSFYIDSSILNILLATDLQNILKIVISWNGSFYINFLSAFFKI